MVQRSVAENMAGFDQRRPRQRITDSARFEAPLLLEGPDSISGGLAELAAQRGGSGVEAEGAESSIEIAYLIAAVAEAKRQRHYK